MLKPYDPDEHRVPRHGSNTAREYALVLTIFVLLPFALCAAVEGLLRVNVLLVGFGLVGFVLGIFYGIRNMDALEDDDSR